MRNARPTYVVWMHANGDVNAVAHFRTRDMADAYARYNNKQNPARWFEVRRMEAIA